jgi:hypothetical protein
VTEKHKKSQVWQAHTVSYKCWSVTSWKCLRYSDSIISLYSVYYIDNLQQKAGTMGLRFPPPFPFVTSDTVFNGHLWWHENKTKIDNSFCISEISHFHSLRNSAFHTFLYKCIYMYVIIFSYFVTNIKIQILINLMSNDIFWFHL